jgi:hypothetical protein
MNMKFYLLILMSIFWACGPGAEEKAAAEKHFSDSIAAAKLKMEEAKDAARQQALQDSILEADSVPVPAEL